MQMLAAQRVGLGGGYDSRCVNECQIHCRWAGGDSFLCWWACAWLCSGPWGVFTR
jgi:hypothetical protein